MFYHSILLIKAFTYVLPNDSNQIHSLILGVSLCFSFMNYQEPCKYLVLTYAKDIFLLRMFSPRMIEEGILRFT